MRSPCITTSSPVLTMTVTSCGGTARASPRRNLPAPMPPASAATLTFPSHLHSGPAPVSFRSRREPRRGTPSRTSVVRSPLYGSPGNIGAVADVVLERAIARSIARAGAGKSLSLDETAALMDARGPQLAELSAIAGSLRGLGHGTTVTYSRKVFIPLTMLCRDHCHYCTFAKPPARLDAPYLTPEETVAIAEAGRRRGCKEALFTLGDRPEDRYDVAREWLTERGFRSTLEYVRAAAIRVIEETGLLPHLNLGLMSYEELARLKHVSASMGLMLETSSDRLSAKGGPHFGSPDKVPAVRLRTIEDAGRLSIPFTTGILGRPPPTRPAAAYPRLLDAGIDDWGGVSPLTPDHVNPEKPWPEIERLSEATAARGLILRERLTVHPEYVL